MRRKLNPDYIRNCGGLTEMLADLYLYHFKGYHTVTRELLEDDISYVLKNEKLPGKCGKNP